MGKRRRGRGNSRKGRLLDIREIRSHLDKREMGPFSREQRRAAKQKKTRWLSEVDEGVRKREA